MTSFFQTDVSNHRLSFAERCLLWSAKNGLFCVSKFLVKCGANSPQVIRELEKRGNIILSFALFPLSEYREILEKAIITEDMGLISFVCERYSFEDWDFALSLALKYKKKGLVKIFVEFGANKYRHVPEYAGTGDPDILLDLLKDNSENYLWDSFEDDKKVYRHRE